MLRWLILRNFKAFAGEHRIRLAPLTLIFGKNSAGKSSIIQSILFLKQSASSLASGGDAKWVGDDVDLGSMEHALYGQGRDPNHDKLTVGAISTPQLHEHGDGRPKEVQSASSAFRTGQAREQAVGVEFTWQVGETLPGDPTKPALAQWGLYETAETHPVIRGSGEIPSDSFKWLLTRAKRFPNAEHPRIAAIHGAISGPLAEAFRRNLEAWARIVDDARARPELRPVAEPIVRYWRLAEGLGELKYLRWLDPRLIEIDFKRRVPRKRTRRSSSHFDPVQIGPRVASWLPNQVPDIDWVQLRTKLNGVVEQFLSAVPARERRAAASGASALVIDAIKWQKEVELHKIASPKGGIDVPNSLQEVWADLDDGEAWSNLNKGELRQILSKEIITFIVQNKNSISTIQNTDLQQTAVSIRSAISEYSILTADNLFREARRFTNSARETSWNRGQSETSLSEHILDHADQFHAIGIQEHIDGLSWYESDFLNSLIYLDLDLSNNARLMIDGQLSRVTHVKGLRPQLRRTYEGLSSTADTGASDRDPTRSLATRLNADRLLVDRINHIMQDIGLPYSLDIQVVSNSVFPIRSHAFYLRDTRNRALVGLQDVGFGVGQLIPVAAELAGLSEDLLLMEQPELHLHPAMQANLGELLVNCIKERPNSQMIIETHSEHVVLRLMRLVREKKIENHLVQILYIDQDSDGKSGVIELPLDEFGEFRQQWPGGFFEERMLEM